MNFLLTPLFESVILPALLAVVAYLASGSLRSYLTSKGETFRVYDRKRHLKAEFHLDPGMSAEDKRERVNHAVEELAR